MVTVKNHNTYAGPAINIMRPNLLGNPFVIGKDGTREEVISKYRIWLWECMNNGSAVGNEVYNLAKKVVSGENLTLLCCCEPLPCHGNVLTNAIQFVADKIKPTSTFEGVNHVHRL